MGQQRNHGSVLVGVALIMTLHGLMGSSADAAVLRAETARAWDGYVRLTEERIAGELDSERGFLIQDFLPSDQSDDCRRQIDSGGICVIKMKTSSPGGGSPKIPDGMVHHWIGAVFVPGVALSELLEWVQRYSDHDQYFNEVESSELLSREGDTFDIFLRLKRDRIVKVRYNTEHHVVFRRHRADRVSSKSFTTRIAQIENPGAADEREKPEGVDSGFLWRLNSYWRYQEVDGGVIVENETLSLSRGVPAAIRWLIARYLDSIPREFMTGTLGSLREGVTVQVARRSNDLSPPTEATRNRGEQPFRSR